MKISKKERFSLILLKHILTTKTKILGGKTMNDLGNISISSEVVASIASSIASDIEGFYSLAGAEPKNELTKFFKSVSSAGNKGIEVEVGETECTIDLYVIAKMGYQLPALAGEIQKRVVKAITEMTGLKVQEVNVYIQKIVKDDTKKVETTSEIKPLDTTEIVEEN